MKCDHVQLPSGGFAIICSSRRPRRRCSSCYAGASIQCDWKTGGGKTCDRWICADHALHVGEDKDLCPEHQVAYREWLAWRAPPVPKSSGEEYDTQTPGADRPASSIQGPA